MEYPQLFHAAEAVSARAQRIFFSVRASELLALTIGAIFGLVDRDAVGGAGPVVALLMFAAALVLQVSRIGQQAERRWYDARAAAESIKSASWQYAVGGEAFRIGAADVQSAFVQRLREVLEGLRHLDIGAATATSAAVTADMQTLRNSSQA
ncbi:MAG: DUF4231 domain-containing protein, partial [Actinobacteria bacterium]|nr:DUF4231 domain-containing protein [Actinomycetota bacterium]